MGETGVAAREALSQWRAHGQVLLRDRFRQAIAEGDLPDDADADLIARYVITTGNGIAVQAASGATCEQLQRVADIALRHWPPG